MYTTLNLKRKDILKIKELSEKCQIREKDLVKLIISEIIAHKPFLENYGSGVSYQEDDPSYTTFHMQFDPVEYEQNLDLKKIYKLSLSFIVAIGLALFCDNLYKRVSDTLINYSGFHESLFLDSYSKNSYIYVSLEDENGRILSVNWQYQRE